MKHIYSWRNHTTQFSPEKRVLGDSDDEIRKTIADLNEKLQLSPEVLQLLVASVKADTALSHTSGVGVNRLEVREALDDLRRAFRKLKGEE